MAWRICCDLSIEKQALVFWDLGCASPQGMDAQPEDPIIINVALSLVARLET